MKNSDTKELQNIAINHSADIDYNNFVRIYRECTKKPYSLLVNDTTLPASDAQVQYDIDRLAAKISAYSSGDLRKYEYLTGEDLGYKPSVFEQAKFDYSPLVNIFTK